MNLTQIKLMFNLKNRQIPNQKLVEQVYTTINDKVYPIGIISDMIFQQTSVYHNYTLQENYTYCKEFINTVFNSFYTNEELSILSLFLLQAIYNTDIITKDKAVQLADSYLFTHSEKKDVEFCLNTLRYVRLTSLLRDLNPDNDLVDQLFKELDGVEEQYNNMNLGANYL